MSGCYTQIIIEYLLILVYVSISYIVDNSLQPFAINFLLYKNLLINGNIRMFFYFIYKKPKDKSCLLKICQYKTNDLMIWIILNHSKYHYKS